MANYSNSQAHLIRSAMNASKWHDWPADAGEASDADMSIYCRLQEQRSLDDWSNSDLISLAQLAKMQSDLAQEHAALRKEGRISYGGRLGVQPIQNPRHRVVTDLISSINQSSRRLGLTHTSQADLRSRANRGEEERKARSVINDDVGRSKSGLALM